jgi:hypothetical protein
MFEAIASSSTSFTQEIIHNKNKYLLSCTSKQLGSPLQATTFHKGKGKAVPLQTRCGPEGSMNLSFLGFMTTVQDGGKFVSLTHRPSLPPRNTPGNHFS